METLEACRICRLCGKHSDISIDIFDTEEKHVRKINTVLPILVHQMDMLPKQMCHRCSYKLEEFHKFYFDCLRTDEKLKSQLSWMKKSRGINEKDKIGVPMVQIENVKIKSEPLDYDVDANVLSDNITYMSHQINEAVCPPFTNNPCCHYCCHRQSTTDKVINQISGKTISNHTLNQVNGIKDNLEKVGVIATMPLIVRSNKQETNLPVMNSQKLKHDKEIFLASTINTTDAEKTGSNQRPTRSLRPRRNSVDYGGSKRKKLTRQSQSTEMKPTVGSIVKVEIVEEDPLAPRALRPRKATVNYLEVKKKKENKSTEPERQIKEQKIIKRKCTDLQEGVVEVKKEIDTIDIEMSTYKPEEALFDTDVVIKKEKINRTWLRGHRQRTLPGKNGFSPIHLRSHDVRLRNGKIKSFIENRKKVVKNLEKIFHETVSDKGPWRVRRNGFENSIEVKIKQFCDKCSICVDNRSSKLHKCSTH